MTSLVAAKQGRSQFRLDGILSGEHIADKHRIDSQNQGLEKSLGDSRRLSVACCAASAAQLPEVSAR